MVSWALKFFSMDHESNAKHKSFSLFIMKGALVKQIHNLGTKQNFY